ncbi:hypothetical protein JB92DRAFT_3136178 [Gautieria morchelliformis]|nr:hypothetical protein JB92DRAFT_3136178 [Gautieria morchelliformis]
MQTLGAISHGHTRAPKPPFHGTSPLPVTSARHCLTPAALLSLPTAIPTSSQHSPPSARRTRRETRQAHQWRAHAAGAHGGPKSIRPTPNPQPQPQLVPAHPGLSRAHLGMASSSAATFGNPRFSADLTQCHKTAPLTSPHPTPHSPPTSDSHHALRRKPSARSDSPTFYMSSAREHIPEQGAAVRLHPEEVQELGCAAAALQVQVCGGAGVGVGERVEVESVKMGSRYKGAKEKVEEKVEVESMEAVVEVDTRERSNSEVPLGGEGAHHSQSIARQ